MTVNDILIKDNNNDTLLYSSKVTAIIKRLDFKNKSTRLGRVTIIKPYVALITDYNGYNEPDMVS